MNSSELIEEARRIGMLICPILSQLEDGDVVERMPNDLLQACSVISRLCDAIEVREGEETGWVIEHGRSDPSRPEYWAATGFDHDNLKAIRFARKEDAERVANCLGGGWPEGYHRIADHMWCP
jgi:hypothetical protein